MLKVGLTGGIGSGKSLVAAVFRLLGVPVLQADLIARHLMDHDEQLKADIIRAFGNEAYKSGRLNRPFLASVVFSDPLRLQELNQLVHPATIAYSNRWAEQQRAPYIIKEAAIFFESGSYTEMDKMAGVYAPYGMRLQRAMQRDNAREEEIRSRMDKQMNEEEKMSRCDYVIRNDETESVISQVLALHRQLTGLASVY